MPFFLFSPPFIKKLSVIGIIGNTHGVSNVMKPIPKAVKNMNQIERPSFSVVASVVVVSTCATSVVSSTAATVSASIAAAVSSFTASSHLSAGKNWIGISAGFLPFFKMSTAI